MLVLPKALIAQIEVPSTACVAAEEFFKTAAATYRAYRLQQEGVLHILDADKGARHMCARLRLVVALVAIHMHAIICASLSLVA